MRLLCVTHPADGHLNPMLGVSAALRAEGHEVLWAAPPRFVSRIEARGERAVACGLDWLCEEGPPEPPTEADGALPDNGAFQRLFLRTTATTVARDLRGVIEGFRPDVLVRETVEFGAAAAAEAAGLPWATIDITFPGGPESEIVNNPDTYAAPLTAIRRAADLPVTDDPRWFVGDLRVGLFPSGYTGVQSPDDRACVQIRPPVLDAVDEAPVPDWLEARTGVVYVTFGTIFNQFVTPLMAAAVRAAARDGRTVVATTGRTVDPDSLDTPRTPDVHVERYVPQGPVLDRAACAILHGGSGSTMGALARSVPVVVVPLGADQHLHAGAVERVGCGVVVPRDQADEDSLAEAVATVLADPTYAARAAEVAEELAAMPGPEAAVAAIADLAD